MKKITFAAILIFIFTFQIFPQNKENISAREITPQNIEKKAWEKYFHAAKVNYPGDSSYNVTYYKLNLRISDKPEYLKGIVTVNGIMEKSSNTIFLDLQDSLNVDSVLSNGNQLSFTHANNKLNMNFGANYNIGQDFSVTVYYEGVPVSSGFGSFTFSTHGNDEPIISSLSEPYGASDWWPCKDTPADKADSSDVWITCDSSLIGVSNGTLISVQNNLDGTKTYKWKNTYPIAQYLISVAISNYSVYTTYYHYGVKDSMPIINYIYPEKLSSVKSLLNETATMIGVFSKLFGQYPFIKEKYGHAEFQWSGGMENQTCTSIGYFSEDVISHELSHQWFGDKITCRDWQDIWLNEGFANYCEALYREFHYNMANYDTFMNNMAQGAKLAEGSIYVQDISSVNQIFNGYRTYDKGAMVLHMLRGIVGDSTFFHILKTYANDPTLIYATATTQDFERDAENVFGSSLSYFFNEWIYGENYPKYTVSWNYSSLGGNDYEVIVNIEQAANSNPSFFTMPIQLKISTTVGDTLIKVFNDEQNQQFVLNVKGLPSNVVLDPNNWILKDVSTPTGIKQANHLLSFKLEQNYPNPFNPTTTIRYSIPVVDANSAPTTRVKLNVYDILGRLVTTLVNERKLPGNYEANFNASGLSSGVYFYKLTYGNYSATRKMILLK